METSGAIILVFMNEPGEETAIGLGRSTVCKLFMDAKVLEMKQCEAPVSNKTFAGISLTGRLPMITSEESSACAAFIMFTFACLGLCLTTSLLEDFTGGGGGRRLWLKHLFA